MYGTRYRNKKGGSNKDPVPDPEPSKKSRGASKKGKDTTPTPSTPKKSPEEIENAENNKIISESIRKLEKTLQLVRQSHLLDDSASWAVLATLIAGHHFLGKVPDMLHEMFDARDNMFNRLKDAYLVASSASKLSLREDLRYETARITALQFLEESKRIKYVFRRDAIEHVEPATPTTKTKAKAKKGKAKESEFPNYIKGNADMLEHSINGWLVPLSCVVSNFSPLALTGSVISAGKISIDGVNEMSTFKFARSLPGSTSRTHAYVLFVYVFGFMDLFDFAFVGYKHLGIPELKDDVELFVSTDKGEPVPNKDVYPLFERFDGLYEDIGVLDPRISEPYLVEYSEKVTDACFAISTVIREQKNESIASHINVVHGDGEMVQKHLFSDFYHHFLSKIGLLEFVTTRVVVDIYTRDGADALSDKGRLFGTFMVDLNSDLYRVAQTKFMEKKNKIQFNIVDPSDYINGMLITTDLDSLLKDTSSDSLILKNKKEHPTKELFNKTNDYKLKFKMATHIPIFFMPIYDRPGLDSKFDAPELRILNDAIDISTATGEFKYVITCIVCKKQLVTDTDIYFAYMRGYDSYWSYYNPYERFGSSASVDPVRLEDYSPPGSWRSNMAQMIDDNAVGVWYMREDVYNAYVETQKRSSIP